MSTPLASASTLGNPAALAKVNQLKAQPRKQGEAAFFFYDAHFKNASVKILPGEYFVDQEDLLVMTTLGSCIATCPPAGDAVRVQMRERQPEVCRDGDHSARWVDVVAADAGLDAEVLQILGSAGPM